jgi:hypothetical protein
VHGSALRRSTQPPLVVDLGYGAYPITTVELARRVWSVRPDARIVGLEIDPARVDAAREFAAPGLEFRLGGFELPIAGEPAVVRAFNVLRQYDEADVAAAWQALTGRLAPGGLLVEGTCSESGRVAVWVALDRGGPRTLTFGARLGSLESPAVFAERLPKALIHRNVPGEPVHAFLAAFERAWLAAAPYSAYGVRQRWIAAAQTLTRDWPVVRRPGRWRLGELTVEWSAVAPRGSGG